MAATLRSLTFSSISKQSKFGGMNDSENKIVLRPLEERDNANIAAIIRTVLTEFKAAKKGTVFFDPTTDDLYHLFKQKNAAYFIAEVNKKVVGGCGVYPTKGLPEDCCELVKLYLLPEARKAGLGKRFIEQSISAAKQFGFTKIYLESLPELTQAVSLYEKLGFTYLPAALGDSKHFGCSLWMIKEL